MQIGSFGTGIVGQTIASALAGKGHTVMIGTRDPRATLARDSGNAFGNMTFREWQAANPTVELGTFAEVARFGEALVNATSSTSATSRRRAAPRCCSPSGSASGARSVPRTSTSRSRAEQRSRRVGGGRSAGS